MLKKEDDLKTLLIITYLHIYILHAATFIILLNFLFYYSNVKIGVM